MEEVSALSRNEADIFLLDIVDDTDVKRLVYYISEGNPSDIYYCRLLDLDTALYVMIAKKIKKINDLLDIISKLKDLREKEEESKRR